MINGCAALCLVALALVPAGLLIAWAWAWLRGRRDDDGWPDGWE